MKTRQTLLAALTVSAVALAGCSTSQLESAVPESKTKDEAAQAHVEMLADAQEAKRMQDEREAYQGAEPDFEAPAEPETEAPAEVETPSPEVLQEWADARLEDWATSFDYTYQNTCDIPEAPGDFRGCGPGDPMGYITDAYATAPGELVVEIGPGAWEHSWAAGMPARYVSSNMLIGIAYQSDDIDQLTVLTYDGRSSTEVWDEGMHGMYHDADPIIAY